MAEKEYIEREAAYQTLTEYYHHTTEGMHSALREAISRVPAADVRPVVRGKWVHCESKMWSGGYYTKCSACGYGYSDAHYHEVEEFNFCPNCGADMRPASMSGANGEES